jgi:hypothetical protein
MSLNPCDGVSTRSLRISRILVRQSRGRVTVQGMNAYSVVMRWSRVFR